MINWQLGMREGTPGREIIVGPCPERQGITMRIRAVQVSMAGNRNRGDEGKSRIALSSLGVMK